ncbi:MAG TPA: DUF2061 domain-containing protein [Chitinophagales bacterium]|nr:DUF2061 domain-containing protein [Chitinophagales bacterium]
MQKDKHFISFSKGVSWRIIGTLDTMLLSYLFTGSIGNALKIGTTEVFTKIGLFYFHERLWFRIKWGLQRKAGYEMHTQSELNDYAQKDHIWQESHLRSVVKGISWRIVGTIDTIIIATFWTGDYTKALQIGFTEVITKVILFYFHERLWMKATKK